MTSLRLDRREQDSLEGQMGPGLQLAAQLVAALGTIYGAEDLVPVASVQVAGVSFRNLGHAGLEFLTEWAAGGATVAVPSTLNPAGMDLEDWHAHGIPEDFAIAQQAVIRAYRAFGVSATCTCTPYLVGNRPRLGEHVAWSESSAVAFANSVLGARTNREGGPAALAAAILGKTARYGLHLDEERRPSLVIDVACELRNSADWGALGYQVGRLAGDRVPLLRLRHPPSGLMGSDDLLSSSHLEHLKTLGAAMAASGAVGLYHIDGVTPEARPAGRLSARGTECVDITDLRPVYEALNGQVNGTRNTHHGPRSLAPDDSIDLVSIGCPHACLSELADLVRLLQGRRVRTAFWVTSSRDVFGRARAEGLAQALEASGVRLMADTCLVVAPMQSYGYRTLATNSAKMAVYAPGHCGLATRFGDLEQCVAAALSGRWQANPGGGGPHSGSRGLSAGVAVTEGRPEPPAIAVPDPCPFVSSVTPSPVFRTLQGRVISAGEGDGRALVSDEPLSFLGGVDPDTGLVADPRHPLCGQDVTGRVLVFPRGCGSTVGSYVLYQLSRNGHAPAAIINAHCEAIVAVGAIIAGVPAVDGIDIARIPDGARVRVEEGGRVVVAAPA